MQLVVLACLAVAAFAAPQQPRNPEHIAILSQTHEDQGDGNFRYSYETENGIYLDAEGAPGSNGQSNIRGSFRFPFPDGTIGEVTYVADEAGYQPQSDLIPAIPAHVFRLLEIAAEQRAAGIEFDEQGFRIN